MNHNIVPIRAAGFIRNHVIGDEPVDAPPSVLDELHAGQRTPRTVPVRVDTLILLGGIIIALLAATLGMMLLGILPDAVAEPQQTCYEDQKCWDPATMGNGLGQLPAGQTPVPNDHSQADR